MVHSLLGADLGLDRLYRCMHAYMPRSNMYAYILCVLPISIADCFTAGLFMNTLLPLLVSGVLPYRSWLHYMHKPTKTLRELESYLSGATVGHKDHFPTQWEVLEYKDGEFLPLCSAQPLPWNLEHNRYFISMWMNEWMKYGSLKTTS